MKINFKDYYLGTIIGFLVGWLILLPAFNIGFKITPFLVLVSVASFSFLIPFLLTILNFLSRLFEEIAYLAYFSKFVVVGILNTFLDLSILNFFIYLTGIAVGFYFSFFKLFSFLIANINSYFWNKFWIFKDKKPVTIKEYSRFLFFTFVGILINVGVASLIVNFIRPPIGLELKFWANIGAIIAVFVAMIWDFLSYKKIFLKT